jgi:hypothetical protein
MGLLRLFSSKSEAPSRPPTGSFTVDRDGNVLSSTLPQTLARGLVREITSVILQTFKTARQVHLPLYEVTVRYSNIKLSAREMRGGAIIYLSAPGSSGALPRTR